jgi:hypothetical protein
MSNLAIAVIAIAVAQVLTILHAIGREREIKKLRELVNEQRLHIVKLSAWLVGRNAAQPPRIKSEREQIREPIPNNMKAPEPAITPKDLPDTIPSTTEDELKRATRAINWLKEDADKAREIVAAQQVTPPEKIGWTTKPIRMLGIHTPQEVDAEVLEMQRLELPVMAGQERTEAYNRLTFKKHGNAEALKEFDDALIKTMATPPKKIG